MVSLAGPAVGRGGRCEGEAAGGFCRGLGAPGEIVVGGGVRVLTIASMGDGMMYPGKSSLSLSRAGARQQVSELSSLVDAFLCTGLSVHKKAIKAVFNLLCPV